MRSWRAGQGALIAFLLSCPWTAAEPVHLPAAWSNTLQGLQDATSVTAQDISRLRERLVEGILSTVPELPRLSAIELDYPYFAFVPNLVASLPLDGSEVHWSGHCFQEMKGRVVRHDSSSVSVLLTAAKPKTLLCTEMYMLACTSAFHLENVLRRGEHEVKLQLPQDLSDADKWDLSSKGIRAFMFSTTWDETLASVQQTAMLFKPLLTQGVSMADAQRNTDFMRRYAGFDIQPRDPRLNAAIAESDVRSGDMFAILRLDGLDPMLAFGMGSTNGHVTTALWIDNELFVIESQVSSSYWPTDNVQRTPFRTWLTQADAAGYNVVHVPLREEYRRKYDEKAALAFFESVEGFSYGYSNLLWGWVDTLKDNYPCLPPDFGRCLEWEFLEVGFALVDRHVAAIADKLWVQAFNLRLGTKGLRTADLYYQASLQGLRSAELPALVEKDSFVYQTTRYNDSNPVPGPAMVCCVFVCSVWKAAGVFGDMDLECTEQTNFDLYSLSLFEDKYRQVLGNYTLFLQDFNQRKPYSHMDEKCPGLPPKYDRPAGC